MPAHANKLQISNQTQGQVSFYNKSLNKPKVSKSNGKSLDKKKVNGILGPVNKKFPELKLMVNGEMKHGNNSLSSDDDMNLAVST